MCLSVRVCLVCCRTKYDNSVSSFVALVRTRATNSAFVALANLRYINALNNNNNNKCTNYIIIIIIIGIHPMFGDIRIFLRHCV